MRKASNSQLRAGAEAVKALIKAINVQSEADLEGAGSAAEAGEVDPRDYRAMVQMVDASLRENVLEAEPDHAQGFLRAMADLLCQVGDHTSPGDEWAPLKTTAKAFSYSGGKLAEPGPALTSAVLMAQATAAVSPFRASDAVDFDFEGEALHLQRLLDLAAFAERARNLCGEIEACADRSAEFKAMLQQRGIAWGDAYWDAEESAGLAALYATTRQLAVQIASAGRRARG